MAVSRLRLELTVWFGLALVVVLGVVAALLYGHLFLEAERLLVADLARDTSGLAAAIRRELSEEATPLREAAAEEIEEFLAGRDAIVVFDASGQRVAARGAQDLVAALTPPTLRTPRPVVRRFALPGAPRVWRADVTDLGQPAFSVVAASSDRGFQAYERLLTRSFGLALPLGALIALATGYMLARPALAPLGAMTRAIDAIGPAGLDRRLPVREPPDELGKLALQFNALLERLAHAQDVNRAFLTQAAHQIRTPLTIVQGEASLALRRSRSAPEYREVLERVARAADQMAHRVGDLFLLAQAQAGDVPSAIDVVELDGLVLECTDLMRGRARTLEHPLELRRVEPVQARGHEPLLREVLLELLENALRHGARGGAVGVSAYATGGNAALEVTSRGAPVPPRPLASRPGEGGAAGGLGLTILDWIATLHGGRLEHEHRDGANTYRFVWPLVGKAASSTAD